MDDDALNACLLELDSAMMADDAFGADDEPVAPQLISEMENPTAKDILVQEWAYEPEERREIRTQETLEFFARAEVLEELCAILCDNSEVESMACDNALEMIRESPQIGFALIENLDHMKNLVSYFYYPEVYKLRAQRLIRLLLIVFDGPHFDESFFILTRASPELFTAIMVHFEEPWVANFLVALSTAFNDKPEVVDWLQTNLFIPSVILRLHPGQSPYSHISAFMVLEAVVHAERERYQPLMGDFTSEFIGKILTFALFAESKRYFFDLLKTVLSSVLAIHQDADMNIRLVLQAFPEYKNILEKPTPEGKETVVGSESFVIVDFVCFLVNIENQLFDETLISSGLLADCWKLMLRCPYSTLIHERVIFLLIKLMDRSNDYANLIIMDANMNLIGGIQEAIQRNENHILRARSTDLGFMGYITKLALAISIFAKSSEDLTSYLYSVNKIWPVLTKSNEYHFLLAKMGYDKGFTKLSQLELSDDNRTFPDMWAKNRENLLSLRYVCPPHLELVEKDEEDAQPSTEEDPADGQVPTPPPRVVCGIQLIPIEDKYAEVQKDITYVLETVERLQIENKEGADQFFFVPGRPCVGRNKVNLTEDLILGTETKQQKLVKPTFVPKKIYRKTK